MKNNRQFECNYQQNKDGKWSSRTFNTQAEAKQAAENARSFGFYNANWQATNPGQENCPAWTRRDGKDC